MQEITIEQAFEDSIEKWEHLTKTGKESKLQEPLLSRYEDYDTSCPMCVYNAQELDEEVAFVSVLTCEACPMFKKWVVADTGWLTATCCDDDTYYNRWVDALADNDVEKVKHHAKGVLDNIKKVYKQTKI